MSYTKGKWESVLYSNVRSLRRPGVFGPPHEDGERFAPICEVDTEDNALRIVHCVNNFDELLEACKECELIANQAINMTPTGNFRDKLTEINIKRLAAIAAAERTTNGTND